MYFVVIDRTNHPIRSFDTYHEADMFRASYNRWDWLIVCKDYVSTQKQREAYANQYNLIYLQSCKTFSFRHYYKKIKYGCSTIRLPKESIL